MKPPIKAIKKIIKFCKSKDIVACDGCEIKPFCNENFRSCPVSWKRDYKELKEELENNDR